LDKIEIQIKHKQEPNSLNQNSNQGDR
jgi:hypothetical protein